MEWERRHASRVSERVQPSRSIDAPAANAAPEVMAMAHSAVFSDNPFIHHSTLSTTTCPR